MNPVRRAWKKGNRSGRWFYRRNPERIPFNFNGPNPYKGNPDQAWQHQAWWIGFIWAYDRLPRLQRIVPPNPKETTMPNRNRIEVTDRMVVAAIAKAVALDLMPATLWQENFGLKSDIMRAVLQAALDESDPTPTAPR